MFQILPSRPTFLLYFKYLRAAKIFSRQFPANSTNIHSARRISLCDKFTSFYGVFLLGPCFFSHDGWKANVWLRIEFGHLSFVGLVVNPLRITVAIIRGELPSWLATN